MVKINVNDKYYGVGRNWP